MMAVTTCKCVRRLNPLTGLVRQNDQSFPTMPLANAFKLVFRLSDLHGYRATKRGGAKFNVCCVAANIFSGFSGSFYNSTKFEGQNNSFSKDLLATKDSEKSTTDFHRTRQERSEVDMTCRGQSAYEAFRNENVASN